MSRGTSTSCPLRSVAKAAETAKGLVHYHFKTKRALMEAVADRLAAGRQAAWKAALEDDQSEGAVAASWTLLTQESATGVSRAWLSLIGPGSPVPDQEVKKMVESFNWSLGQAAARMLDRELDLRPSIPIEELGPLLGAIVDGMSVRLSSGGDPDVLGGAYAAAWLGILSLSKGGT